MQLAEAELSRDCRPEVVYGISKPDLRQTSRLLFQELTAVLDIRQARKAAAPLDHFGYLPGTILTCQDAAMLGPCAVQYDRFCHF
jgi:hypothetical protein